MTFSPEQLTRYSRHFILREIGVSGQKRLMGSKVLVIGAGALGSAALMYLTAAGIGTVGIADYDRVDLSNLQRQIVHSTGRVGAEKTVSAKQTLEDLNPGVNFNLYPVRITPFNIRDIIEPYDFIVDCTDRFETKFLINDACVLSEKPYSHAGVLRFSGQAMTYVPNLGSCLRCVLEDVPAGSETCAQSGVLGSVTGILGSIQATETIKYLLGIGDLLVGRVLHIDGLSMEMRSVNMGHSRSDCRVCGKHPTILSLTDNTEDYEISCGA